MSFIPTENLRGRMLKELIQILFIILEKLNFYRWHEPEIIQRNIVCIFICLELDHRFLRGEDVKMTLSLINQNLLRVDAKANERDKRD